MNRQGVSNFKYPSLHSVLYIIKHVQRLLPDYLHNIFFRMVMRFYMLNLTRGSSVVCQTLIKSERSYYSPRHSIIHNWNQFHSFVDLNKSLVNNKIRLKNRLISNY